MTYKLIAVLLVSCCICACSKPDTDVNSIASQTPARNVVDNAILIDASKDGGVWWYPQAGSFSATLPHQGKTLADYLRIQGYTVDELSRGTIITWDLLKKYNKVIRANGFEDYTQAEIAAYDSFLHYSSALLLLSDHLQNSPNDKLSAHLGLTFSGSYTGTVLPSSSHAINTGVSSLPYIAGSVILQPDLSKMMVLGKVGSSSSESGYAAMGILYHPTAKVFFMGDTNSIEQLPQPFTTNLIKWLFQ